MAGGLLSEFTVEAEGVAYRLRMDMNALVAFEEMTGGKNAFEAIEEMGKGKGSFRDMRHLVRAMLLRHRPEATLVEAGDVMSSGLQAVMDGISAAMPQAVDMPEDAPGNVEGRTETPQEMSPSG